MPQSTEGANCSQDHGREAQPPALSPGLSPPWRAPAMPGAAPAGTLRTRSRDEGRHLPAASHSPGFTPSAPQRGILSPSSLFPRPQVRKSSASGPSVVSCLQGVQPHPLGWGENSIGMPQSYQLRHGGHGWQSRNLWWVTGG